MGMTPQYFHTTPKSCAFLPTYGVMPRIAIKGLVVSPFNLLLTFLCSLTLTPIPKLALTPLPNDALLANLNRWVDSAAQVFSAC